MGNRQILTVSLSNEMMEQVEALRGAEHRSRSELVREALRTYLPWRYAFPKSKRLPRKTGHSPVPGSNSSTVRP